MRYVFSIIFSCIVLLPTYALADIFPIMIRSAYLDSRTVQWGKEVRWIFTGVSEFRVDVTQEGTEDPVVLLEYDQNGRLQRVEKHIRRGNSPVQIVERPQSPIVLSKGFPVPYDYLAPYDDRLKEAVIKRRAGGLTFSYRVTREIRQISLDEAVAQNMVEGEMARDLIGKALRLITIRKGGALLVRQLWPDGASWWVYEETPVRRSWRGTI